MLNNTIELIYHQHGHSSPVTAMYYDDKYIITGDRKGVIQVLDSKSFKPIATIYAHHAPISSVWVLDNNLLLTGSRDSLIKVWSLKTFDLLTSVSAHIGALLKIEVADNYIYSIGVDGSIKRWHIEDNHLIFDSSTKAPGVTKIFILAGTILCTTDDGLLSIYDLKTLKLRGYLRLNASKVAKAIGNMFKNEKRKDNQAQFFNNIVRQYGIPISDAKLIKDKVVCAHHFGLISIWDIKKWKHRDAYFAHSTHIAGMIKVTSPNIDEVLIATASLDKTIKVHNPFTKSILLSKDLSFRPSVLSSNAEGNKVLLGFENGEFSILDTNIDLLFSLPPVDEISSAALSPLGLIIGLRSGKIKILNLDDFSIKQSLNLFNHVVSGLVYTNDKIIAVSASGIIKVLDKNLQTVKEIDLDFRPDNVAHIRYYLTLKDPFVFDTKTLSVIKGTVSEDTKKIWRQQMPFSLKPLGNDLLISIRSTSLDFEEDIISKKDQEFIADTLKKLIETKDNKPYQRKELIIFNSNNQQ